MLGNAALVGERKDKRRSFTEFFSGIHLGRIMPGLCLRSIARDLPTTNMDTALPASGCGWWADKGMSRDK